MKQEIIDRLKNILEGLDLPADEIKLEYPENLEYGDFSANVAMAGAKKVGMNPRALAEKIVALFKESMPEHVSEVEVAGPGFINFRIADKFFARKALALKNDISSDHVHGSERQVIIEYTDPNTFKVFHIGHLMSNAIGESISRLIEDSGVKVVRLCYPSDIGLHIAKSLWAVQKHLDDMPTDSDSIQKRTEFLGAMYVEGTQAYENDLSAKDDIDALNKVVYEHSSPAVNELYLKGRRWSLEHFDLLYKRLGTTFGENIFESDMAPVGLALVREYEKKGVFEESEGAVVFKGEKYGLHTRVFINSQGLPTYEAKEMGLNTTKFKKYPKTDLSIVVTASEQNDYFKVVLKALSLIDENVGRRTLHIGHGMMRFQSGKMSSRTGQVITAENLISDIRELVKNKISERHFNESEADKISDIIAIGAIKYSILRSAPGSDIIFDSAASISFEGDSGPYLQYSVVRANSIVEKAAQDLRLKISDPINVMPEKAGYLERMIVRFPDMVERARHEHAPQIVANYLTTLAGAFNSFYGAQVIIDRANSLTPYYVALTNTFKIVMTRGLWLLGIGVPDKM